MLGGGNWNTQNKILVGSYINFTSNRNSGSGKNSSSSDDDNSSSTIVGSDTLTWDGDTEGLASTHAWYKVSDVVPTIEDVGTESSCICYDILNEELWVQELNGGALFLGGGEVIIVPPSAVGIDVGGDADGVVFPEPGVYFINGTSSFTIPGYTGFTQT